MQKIRSTRGITLVESMIGMVILIMVIGTAMVAIRSISKSSASQVMRNRAETMMKDAVEDLRNLSGIDGHFEDEDPDTGFRGIYYFPDRKKYSTPPDVYLK